MNQRSKRSVPKPLQHTLQLRDLGTRDYESVWKRMQSFTATRDESTPDELWLVQHPPIFTVGLNGKKEHLLKPGNIPVIQVDRGGQVTYHGPGQLVIYLLLDLTRRKLGVSTLVNSIEQSVIDLLAQCEITAERKPDAPGVYVAGSKLAALGLRVKRGRCYHGLALNVDMDLEPFSRINPCGFPGLRVSQLRDLGVNTELATLARQLEAHLMSLLGYTSSETQTGMK